MARRPQNTQDDVQKVAIVPAPAPENGFVAGEALTPEQRAGLAPLDPARDAEQAADREHRPNMQTDHEAENALDPVSGGPSPGITADAPLTARQVGAPPSDMNGRPPMLSEGDKEAMGRLRDGLKQARRDDRASGHDDKRVGWRTPQQLGISGAVVKRIIEATDAPVESETAPNGHFFPETGTRYRLK